MEEELHPAMAVRTYVEMDLNAVGESLGRDYSLELGGILIRAVDIRTGIEGFVREEVSKLEKEFKVRGVEFHYTKYKVGGIIQELKQKGDSLRLTAIRSYARGLRGLEEREDI